MKQIIISIITIITANCAFAQTEHEWRATLKVVDEQGSSISDAKAGVGYFINSVGTSVDGFTDTNGFFVASHTSYGGALGCVAEKLGYYATRQSYVVPFDYDPIKWNPTITMVLKKIGKPIPMYAKNARIEIPEINTPVGFDVMKGDWVAPYGKGVQSDFIFQAQRRWVSRYNFDSTLKISFSNPGDGLIPVSVPLNQGSELRMAATAPADGYLSQVLKSLSHTPGSGWVDNEREGNKEINYYFRVRASLDESGNVRSALYGKIYEDFALDPINSKTMKIFFLYYLNPEPNSRDVEFDPKQDLFKQLSFREEVKKP